MKKLALVLAAGMVAGQVLAGSFQAKMVSDSARWVVHADLELLKQTTVGSFLVNQLDAGDTGNKMAALSAILQFDPRKDLTGVTMYGQSREPSAAVAVFSGTFNVPQLVTLLKANPSYESAAHGGNTIHSWVDEKKPGERSYGCAHSGKILIGQGLPMLKEALDVLDGKHAALDAAASFGELPVKEPFFMAGTDLPGLVGKSEAQMLSQAKSVGMALGEKDGQVLLSVILSTLDAETAVKLQQIAQGLLAMGQMNQEKEPELAALLQAAQVTVNGTQVKLNAAYPSEKIVTLIQQKMKGPPLPVH
jgi:hypothetical protein